jgi:cell division protein ZapD
LRLLRASGRSDQLLAKNGTYQVMLGGRSYQLIRLQVMKNNPVIPQISAGKLAINIRFLRPDMVQRPRQVEADIEFDMTLCNL